MDANTISRMAVLLKVAATAAGLDPSDVHSGPESVGIIGTGVDVTRVADGFGKGYPGWEVRATYHVAELGSAGRTETEVIAVYAPEEGFQAARQAVISIVQRRVEAALAEAI